MIFPENRSTRFRIMLYSRLIAVTSLPAALMRAIASRVFSITVAM